MSNITKLFQFNNSDKNEIIELKNNLRNIEERRKTMKMLNTLLGFTVDYNIFIDFLNKHIQKKDV